MDQILNGIHDDYIEQFAEDAKSLKSKILSVSYMNLMGIGICEWK